MYLLVVVYFISQPRFRSATASREASSDFSEGKPQIKCWKGSIPSVSPRYVYQNNPSETICAQPRAGTQCLYRVWKSLPHTACPLKCQSKWWSLEGFFPNPAVSELQPMSKANSMAKQALHPQGKGEFPFGIHGCTPHSCLWLKLATSADCIQQGLLY